MADEGIIRKRKKRSRTWEYFTPKEDELSAVCNQCGVEVKTPRKGTTGLFNHLEKIHKIYLSQMEDGDDGVNLNPNEVISRLAAEDGISFRVIASSKMIRKLYSMATRKTLVSSPTSVQRSLMNFYAEKKVHMIEELGKIKESGKLVSLSIDEWTSGAQKRYMNVNVHTPNQIFNLGLARIEGSFSSEACLGLLKTKIEDFGLNLSNVFAVVTDGASVMRKFGRISGRQPQLCFAHAIHLSVIDVLYKQNHDLGSLSSADLMEGHSETQENQNNDDEMDFSADILNDLDVLDVVGESETDEEFSSSFMDENEEGDVELAGSLNDTVNKIRKLVKMFRNSPLKFEYLQRNCDKPDGVKLILDTKTRWNSLYDMLERFLELEEPIHKALVELHEPFNFTEQEIGATRELVRILKPVKMAAETICRKDATLWTADVVFEFMLKKLSSCTEAMGTQMYNVMKKRILERRTIASDLMAYLRFGLDKAPGYPEFFAKPNKKTLIEGIKKVCELFPNLFFINNNHRNEVDNSEPSQSVQIEMSMEAELNLALMQAKNFKRVPTAVASQNLTDQIKKEMTAYQSGAKKGRILQMVYDILLSVPPSTVEAERTFSVSNGFCTKTRSRLGDKSLDALVFLRSYLRNE